MTQYIPPNDSFNDAGTPVVPVRSQYMRLRLWTTNPTYASGGTGTLMDADPAAPNLFNGWFGQASPLQLGQSANPAAGLSASPLAANTLGFQAYLWKGLGLLDSSTEISWQLQSESPSAHHPIAIGPLARIQGGSYPSTVSPANITNASCYAFLILTSAFNYPYKLELLRINSGTVTRLAESPVGSGVFSAFTAGSFRSTQHLRMSVENAGSDVHIRCFLRLETSATETEIFDYTDSSGSKITTAGRNGFALSAESRSAENILGACCINWWQITSVDGLTTYVRDEWQRTNPTGTTFFGPTQAWRTGNCLMPGWYGEQQSAVGTWPQPVGPILFSDVVDSGIDRLGFFSDAVEPLWGAQEYNVDGVVVSQRPADSITSQSRQITGRYASGGDSVQPRGFGIALRCSIAPPSTIPFCYFCLHTVDDAGSSAKIELYRYSTDGLQLLAQKTGLTYSLDTDLILKMAVDSSSTGIARMRVRLGGSIVVLTAPPSPISGVSIQVDGSVFDSSPEKVSSGPGEGFYVRKRQSGFFAPRFLYIDEWTQSTAEDYSAAPASPNQRITKFEIEVMTKAPLAEGADITPDPHANTVFPLVSEGNWRGEFIDETVWDTNISRSKTKIAEERESRATRPVRNFSILASGLNRKETARLISNSFQICLNRSSMPIYSDFSEIVSVSGAQIFCDTTYRRLYVGQRVGLVPFDYSLINDLAQVQIGNVIQVEDTYVLLDSAPVLPVNPGDFLFPMIDAEVSLSQEMQALTDGVVEWQQIYSEVSGKNTLTPTSGSDVSSLFSYFLSLPIWDIAFNWRDELKVGILREGESYASGNTQIVSPDGEFPVFTFGGSYEFYDRAELWRALSFFDSRRGRTRAFWAPHPNVIFDSVTRIDSLTLEAVVFTTPDHIEDIAEYLIARNDDDTFSMHIIDSVSASGPVLTIFLNSSTPVGTTAIEYTLGHLCRFDQDNFKITWHTDGVATVSLAHRSIREEGEFLLT